MEEYIKQLIEDLESIYHKRKCSANYELWNDRNPGELDFQKFIKEIEDPYTDKLYIITGIKTEYLPPAEKLNTHQKELLSVQLEKILCAFNYCIDFPSGVPDSMKYPFILGILNQKTEQVEYGVLHIDVCDFDIDHCPFPEYCDLCKEFEPFSNMGYNMSLN